MLLYHALYLAHAARAEREAARAAATGTLVPALMRGYRVVQQAEQPTGWSRLARCRRALDALDRTGWQRSFHQKQFHDSFIQASMRVFWKTEAPGSFSRDYKAILEHHGCDTLPQEMLVSTPRRFGKTVSVSMFSAALLYSCPEIELSVYSTCLRISFKLLRGIIKFLEMIFKALGEEPFAIVASNAQELRLRGPEGSSDIRICNSYPSRVIAPSQPQCACSAVAVAAVAAVGSDDPNALGLEKAVQVCNINAVRLVEVVVLGILPDCVEDHCNLVFRCIEQLPAVLCSQACM
jgi:hypothetical protein